MKRSAVTAAGLALLSASGCQMTQPSGPERPNILFIFTDDHAFQALSAYGHDLIETPNLDRIARDGVIFTNSFVGNSISAPSRATLFTGKHSHANGQKTNADIFDGSQTTFPKLLQQAGYQTALIGKWHLQSDPTGFDYWNILPGQGSYYNPDFFEMGERKHYEGYVTNLVTDFSIDWLNKQWDREKPFLLMIQHKAVHREWMPDTTYFDEFRRAVYSLPETFYDDYQGRMAAAQQDMSIHTEKMDLVYDLKMADSQNMIQTRMSQWYREGIYGRMTSGLRNRWDEHYLPIIEDFKAANLSGHELSEWKYQRYMQDYLACVRSLDENVGRLLNYLDENGLLDNTLVIYTSDQGFYLGEHGWFDKRFMYEESFRTPLLMHLPKGYGRNGEINEMVQNIDHAPSILDIVGLEIPSDMHGKSMVPLLKNKKISQWRDALYYHYYEYPGEHSVKRHFGIFDGRYKLIRFYHDIDVWEFFDLEKDPLEIENQYSNPEYSTIIDGLKSRLRELMVEYQDGLALNILDGEGYFKVSFLPQPSEGKLMVVLNTDLEGGGIVYTTDGTEPNVNSLKYYGPVEINRSLILKARAYRDGKLMGIPGEQEFLFHKASGKNVKYEYPPSPRFMSQVLNVLTDGLRGSIMLSPNWHGFQGEDMVATIDLEEVQTLSKITLGTLQRKVDWVFPPQWVELEVSLDGVLYKEVGRFTMPEVDELPQRVDFTINTDGLESRFLRITARNFGMCPPGHAGDGNPAWLFVDEIIVN